MISECEPLTSSTKSAPKVIKRKPASPPNDGDFSRSRPVVAQKLSAKQGMIPPPPTPVQTTAETIDRTKSEYMQMFTSTSTSTIPSQSLILSPTTLNTTKDSSRIDAEVPGYSATLTPKEAESIKPTSPSCLRPYRKVEDVTTVKRQPKSGWL